MTRPRKPEWQSEVAAPMISLMQKSNILPTNIVVYLSLIILFNVEIRSIGQISVVPDIGIAPKFWLSDIGLFLPLIWLKIKNIRLFNRPIPIAIVLISFYGLIIAVIRNNPLQSIGQDLRTILAFFSGFATILIIKEMSNVLKVIINMELILSLAATAVILFLPGGGVMAGAERLTHPASFILLTTPIIIFSTAIICANSLHKTAMNYKAWLCGLILIINAAIIMQTRSMFITVSFGILFSIVSSYATRSFHKDKRKNIVLSIMMLISFIIILGVIINNKTSNLENFVARLRSGQSSYDDAGVRIRLAEIPTVFSEMTNLDHVFGMGLNPASELVDFQGIEYNNLHIGILNVWWRFGAVVFFIVNILIIRAIGIWLASLIRVSKRLQQENTRVAILICTPGLMAAYIIALTSGGWSISFAYGLGIVYGIYVKIRRESSYFGNNNKVSLHVSR